MLVCTRCRRAYPEGTATCEKDGTELVPESLLASLDPDLKDGDIVGEYRIDTLIGRGGFGSVYRATHPVIGKPAAVKVLNRQYSSNPEMVARFLAEARAVNRIGHKNIVDIFSFGTTADGRQYYVMELLRGAPLDEYLAEEAPVPVTRALPILKGVARAMDAAHAAGILHRDLKPANVFLSFDHDEIFPKLLDFGIAKLLGEGQAQEAGSPRTGTGVPIGTPYYMSPEQCRGAAVDPRADVYSFGVLVHEMLTGRLPFKKESHLEVMMQHLSAPIPAVSEHAPDVGTILDEPIRRMLAKDAADRPATLGVALQELAQAAEAAGLGVDSSAYAPVTGPGAPPRSNYSGASAARLASISNAATVAQRSDATLSAQSLGAPPRGGRRLLAVLSGVALISVAAASAWLLRPKADPAQRSIPAAATAAVAPPAPAPVDPLPAAAPAGSVRLTIASIPERVEVLLGDTRLGEAPGPLSLVRGDAKVRLTLRATGYQPKTIEVVPNADAAVSVTLARTTRKAGARRPKELEF